MQLHHLLVEYWDKEVLESIMEHIGPLLKVDEHAISVNRERFARVCLDIDLFQPLNHGFCVGDDDHKVFAVILYECMLTFCYSCALIGHSSGSCSL